MHEVVALFAPFLVQQEPLHLSVVSLTAQLQKFERVANDFDINARVPHIPGHRLAALQVGLVLELFKDLVQGGEGAAVPTHHAHELRANARDVTL